MGTIARWLDERIDLASSSGGRCSTAKMPAGLTWWHTLGSATLTVFVVQVVTGIVLAMYYSPSPDHAYDSIRYLERTVVSGAMLRGIHHWGASAMVVLVTAHMHSRLLDGRLQVSARESTGCSASCCSRSCWRSASPAICCRGTRRPTGRRRWGRTSPARRRWWADARDGCCAAARSSAPRRSRASSRCTCCVLPALLAVIVGSAPGDRGAAGHRAAAARARGGCAARTDDPRYAGVLREALRATPRRAACRSGPTSSRRTSSSRRASCRLLVLLGRYAGAGLEPPADPNDTSYVPRPEWYFLPFFQLLKLVPGSMESARGGRSAGTADGRAAPAPLLRPAQHALLQAATGRHVLDLAELTAACGAAVRRIGTRGAEGGA